MPVNLCFTSPIPSQCQLWRDILDSQQFKGEHKQLLIVLVYVFETVQTVDICFLLMHFLVNKMY